MPCLTCSLAERPVLTFIFLPQPSAAGIPMCGIQGGWRKRAYFLRLWEGRAAPVTVIHEGHPGLAFMTAVAVTSQHSLESTASPIRRAKQLLGGDSEPKASFGASLRPASP